MSTHNEHDPNQIGESNEGYETSDVNVQNVMIFVVSLGVFLAVFFIFCWGMGKVINNALEKRDGEAGKWQQEAQAGGIKGHILTPNPVIQQRQLAQLTQRFPTPRLQADDGNQDTVDLNEREDLLLEHYSWADKSKGQVRIPIGRAMELVAERGLPVAPAATTSPLMTADEKPVVLHPLTNGFARTGYEQDVMQMQQQQLERKAGTGEHASLAAPK